MAQKKNKLKYLKPLSGIVAWIWVGIPVLVMVGLLSGILGSVLGVYLIFSKDLPNIPDLKAYRPKTVSTFYADDGSVIGVFYKEKRFPVPLASIPPNVTNAFLAAEDARFFSHPGIDLIGISRAIVRNLKSGNFSQGASTITQQVTRNFILTKEKKISRKIREAILSFRLEKSLSKQEILNLYLNEIYLGRGAYGVEAAARTYFGKSAGAMSIAEAAMIAGLVSNPNKYAPPKNLENALRRREFVLNSMLRNNFISEADFQKAMSEAPTFRESFPNPFSRAPYFTEAVRQKIIEKYGSNRLYNEGLQVWTTMNPVRQTAASAALLNGAQAWEKREGRPVGLVKRLKPAEAKEFLNASAPNAINLGDLVQGLVVEAPEHKKRKGKKNQDPVSSEHVVALRGALKFSMNLPTGSSYRINDLLEFQVVEDDSKNVSLKHITSPPVQGALVCIENRTGYVMALVGGLDFDTSSFNRATQAMRQPGSAFKPVVYSAALEWAGYSPNTLVVDEPIAVLIDQREPEWVPANSDGGFIGATNLTNALALSRNVVAIKLLMDVGLETTINAARNMGIKSPLGRNLSLGLGSSEVTPLELTAAYTVFPNMGMRISPVMIKKVVDRFGNVLEDNTQPLINADQNIDPAPTWMSSYQGPHNQSVHDPDEEQDQPDVSKHKPVDKNNLNENQSPGLKLESVLTQSFPSSKGPDVRVMERAISPQTAFLMVQMLSQACVSGTASNVAKLRRNDLAGKTGTTDDCADAWFIGFNPTYTTGVWMGFDSKLSLGKREYGGVAALPVWMDFMGELLKGTSSEQYAAPPGLAYWGKEDERQDGYGRKSGVSGADFDPRLGAKAYCPVDAPHFMYSGDTNSMQQPWSMGYPQTYMYQGGIRVLSPTGQTIGYASTLRDDRGRSLFYPEGPYEGAMDYSELQESYNNYGGRIQNSPYQSGSGYMDRYPSQVWGR